MTRAFLHTARVVSFFLIAWLSGEVRAQTAPTREAGSDASVPASRTSPAADKRRSGFPLRYTLEGIEVRGNTRTRTRVVLRYVHFAVGDVIDVDNEEIELTRYRLLGTGFFRDVQISLRKGSERGFVIFVIEVFERNTVIINDLWLGLSADADNEGNSRPLTAYGGIDASETNLAGTGITLGSAVGLAQDQLALRVRFLDPAVLGGKYMSSASLLYNNTKDFFGNAAVEWGGDFDNEGTFTDHAVVRYKRFGGAVGAGRDLSLTSQFWLHYRLESIDATYPLWAFHRRGENNEEPIDFDIVRGNSALSALRATFEIDTRDTPFLPTRGWFTQFTAEAGLKALGSDYDYQRFDVQASGWWRLPFHEHVFRLELFAGTIAGDAPFFEQYYVGDFSDFLPGRLLGMNVDRRPPPNFLNTQIVEVRYGQYAAKLGGEYRIPLYRGYRSVFGIDLFASTGVYAVASQREIDQPAPGYTGFAKVPIDLSANVGLRMDTSAGGFTFAFSNVLGFIPVRGEGPAGE